MPETKKKQDKLIELYGVGDEQKIFDFKSTERQCRALVTGKAIPVEMKADECKRLCDKVKLTYVPGYEARVIRHITTNETVDRYGDIVQAKGGDFKTNYFPKNPVIMLMHQYNGLVYPTGFPIGNTLKITYDAAGRSIPAEGLYADNTADPTGRSDASFKMVSNGFMKAVSIGFLPLKDGVKKADDKEKEKLGMGQYGVIYVKWEYLEYSPCGIPANPDALANCFEGADQSVLQRDFDEGVITLLAKEEWFEDINLLDMFTERIKGVGTKEQVAMGQLSGGDGKPKPMKPKKPKKETPEVPEVQDYGETLSEADIKEIEDGVDIEQLECVDNPNMKDLFPEGEDKVSDCERSVRILGWIEETIEAHPEIKDYLKPFANEHACRLMDPSQFTKFARKNCHIKSNGKCIDCIFGIKSGKAKMQAFRYPKNIWQAASAKKHCSSHKGSFEAASGKDADVEINEQGLQITIHNHMNLDGFIKAVEELTRTLNKILELKAEPVPVVPAEPEAPASGEPEKESYTLSKPENTL